MSNTININAETGANFIGDDSSPSLTLENSSTGEALRLQTTGGVPLSIVSTPTTGIFANTVGVAGHFRSNATEEPALAVDQGVVGSSTIAVMRMTQSAASGAFFEFRGFLASIASASSLQRGIRVKFGDSYGWIPVYVGGVFT